MMVDGAGTACTVICFLTILLLQNGFGVADLEVLGRVVDHAVLLYNSIYSRVRHASLTPIEVANYCELVNDVDYNDWHGCIADVDNEFFFVPLREQFLQVEQRFGDSFRSILVIKDYSRVVARIDGVYYLIDSHGTLGNVCVPFDLRDASKSVVVRFASLDALLACIRGFGNDDNDQYSLFVLHPNVSSDKIKGAVTAHFGNLLRPTTNEALLDRTSLPKSFAAAAAAAAPVRTLQTSSSTTR